MSSGTCLSPPLSVSGAPQTGLNIQQCASVLDVSGGLCCTQAELDYVDGVIDQYRATYTSSCAAALSRLRCAIYCAPDLEQWWDPTISNGPGVAGGRAHLCTNFCHDLWVHCYLSGASTATLLAYQSESEFCTYNSGPNRANASACLGHHGDSAVGTDFEGSVDAAFLQAPRPPPSPPSPPPPPKPPPLPPAPPSGDDGAGSATGIAIAGTVGGAALLLCAGYFLCLRKPPPAGGSGKYPPLETMCERFRSELEIAEAGKQLNSAQVVERACRTLGINASVAGILEKAQLCWEVLDDPSVKGQPGRQQGQQRSGMPPQGQEQQRKPRGCGGMPNGTPGAMDILAAMKSQVQAELSKEDEERRRMHTELDARLDEQKAVGMVADLEAALPSTLPRTAGGGGTRPTAPPSGCSSSFGGRGAGARAPPAGSKSFGGGRRTREEDVAPARDVEVGEKVADPFLDILAQTAKAPQDAAELRRAARESRAAEAAREHTRGRSARRGDGGGGGGGGGEDGAHPRERRQKSRAAADGASRREVRRQRKKDEAAQHVTGWAQAHKSVYEQLASLPAIGPPIFPDGWTPGNAKPGDAKALRRAYHKATAKCHPDKTRDLPLNAQALAEEIFKALGGSYQKEMARLEARDGSASVMDAHGMHRV
jgi:hypothetical protein